MLDFVPDFETDAPVQRKIVAHEVNVLSDPDWGEGSLSLLPDRQGVAPLKARSLQRRPRLGSRLLRPQEGLRPVVREQGRPEGAMLSTQTSAESLIIENGAVVGVRTTHEDLRAKRRHRRLRSSLEPGRDGGPARKAGAHRTLPRAQARLQAWTPASHRKAVRGREGRRARRRSTSGPS